MLTTLQGLQPLHDMERRQETICREYIEARFEWILKQKEKQPGKRQPTYRAIYNLLKKEDGIEWTYNTFYTNLGRVRRAFSAAQKAKRRQGHNNVHTLFPEL